MTTVGVWLALAALSGLIGASIGGNKGLGGQGFWLGALLGPIGWLIVATQKPTSAAADATAAQEGRVKCPHCAEWIRSEAAVCRFCGRDVQPA
jgi:hypothetical protein